MSHFPITYAGNKRREVELLNYITDYLDINPHIDTICEPYCGTSAVSFYIANKYPGRFKFILNDNNQHLIQLYDIIKNNPGYADTLNNIKNAITCAEEYPAGMKGKTFEDWWIQNYAHGRYVGQYWGEGKMKKDVDFNGKFRDFLLNEHVLISLGDGIDCLKANDNVNTLIYLDPPYIGCYNDFYLNTDMGIYEMLAEYLPLGNVFNCKLILNIEGTWFIKIIFKNNIKSEYDKTYEGSKKKTKHLIISN